MSYGPLALQQILTNGGSIYEPMRVVRPLLKAKRFYIVKKVPVYRRLVYVVNLKSAERQRFDTAIQRLRYVASMEFEP